MSFSLAFLTFAAGTILLVYLDREQSIPSDKAMWLPTIWFWIVGSRPVSAWLGIWFGIGPGQTGEMSVKTLDAQLDGSPLDAMVFMALLAAGAFVLYKRKGRATGLLKAIGPVLIYFSYCLLSCVWSPFPDVAFKRWIKDVCELVMVLVVVTDAEPLSALRRLFSRVGFVIFPGSILLTRYSELGRGFDPDGGAMNTGVTTNKNTLGLITFIIAIGVVWSFIHLLKTRREPNRGRQIVARGALVALALIVLGMAHSATSIACLTLGSVLIIATDMPFIRRHPSRVHALVAILLLFGGVAMLFGGAATVAGALGRDTTLTGRTDIWKAVIPMCPNSLIGSGFESFWNSAGKNVQGLSEVQKGLNSAHNGYIEVYLNLGVVGLGLIFTILISGYRNACGAFRRIPEIGSLMLAFVATSVVYSVTEAGFRIMTPTWFCLLLAVVASSGTASGVVVNGAQQPRRTLRARPLNPWSDYKEAFPALSAGDRRFGGQVPPSNETNRASFSRRW